MKNYIIGFDYLRVLAAFSVVWIHACHTNALLASVNFINDYAVPAFVLLSCYLLGKKYDGLKFNKKKAVLYIINRVVPQYIFWTLIYLTFRAIKNYLNGSEFIIDFYTIFLGGSSVQLWFLPAIIIWHIILIYYWNKIKSSYIDLIVIIITFVLGRYLMANGFLKEGFLNCFALYSGYIFTSKLIYQNQEVLKKTSSLVFLIFGLFCLMINQFYSSYLLIVLYSISLFLFFLFLKIDSNKLINSFSNYSFGIYLAHFLFVQFFVFVAQFFNLATATITFTLFNIIGSFLLSYLLGLGFKRIKYLNRVI